MNANLAARFALSLAMVLAAVSMARATADGPDFFMVRGVAADDVLNIRAEPTAKSKKIGEIPPDGDGIRNLGCEGGLSIDAWLEANREEREASDRRRWCRIAYQSVEGWVAGRFLEESAHQVPASASEPLSWSLTALNGEPPAAQAFMRFADDGAVSGSTGCNQFRTLGTFHGGVLWIDGPIATTRMACPDAAVTNQEKTVLAALQGRIDISFDPFSEELILSNPQAGIVMRLVRLRN
ncbi:META domain-containing protein [Hoeflea sp.]|uniref:META domain-containing protein n=1 Tax=Hoeflea sp. TaxID=1940281 RepID=UPI003B02E133